jgi:hypothetical protein
MSAVPEGDGEPVTVDFHGQPMTFRFSGHLTPSGGRPLGAREIETAHKIADRIGDLRLAPVSGLAKGANNWAGSEAAEWHPYFDKGARRFEHLRLFCQPFTGYDPIDNVTRGDPPKSIPPDIDARLSSRAEVSIRTLELLSDQRRLPDRLRVRMPMVLGESGPICDGIVASYDAWTLQNQINGLYGSGVIDRLDERVRSNGHVTVADIGSGFGGLAYQLARALPAGKIRLVAIDLPNSLLFAALYLATLWADRPMYLLTPEGYLSIATWQAAASPPDDFAAIFVPNYLAERVLTDLRPVDLITNFRSMQEMSDEQVQDYGRLARKTLGYAGILYEQNDMTRAIDRDVKAILGKIMSSGGVLPETDPPHRSLGIVSVWSNRRIDLARPTL